MIRNIRIYPDDGKHQEYITKLPFTILKGVDPFRYSSNGKDMYYNDEKKWGNRVDNRWIALTNASANPSLKFIFKAKLSKDIDKVLEYCKKTYLKSLKLELKRIEKEIKEEIVV